MWVWRRGRWGSYEGLMERVLGLTRWMAVGPHMAFGLLRRQEFDVNMIPLLRPYVAWLSRRDSNRCRVLKTQSLYEPFPLVQIDADVIIDDSDRPPERHQSALGRTTPRPWGKLHSELVAAASITRSSSHRH